ncbi:hypothetical protein [Sphingomonas aracearum]|uniref:Homogentisate 1,2-dioxygenase n=1 Tax=Sphingomonas aracearum TaxID=2283317 RepID=A0A369W0J5_9SPHN|nr:hypothetical protein [Sphingomonas aracearum]RDE06880.1 hypothetical protein DVW87_04185 [Sphingomonas aracearum]
MLFPILAAFGLLPSIPGQAAPRPACTAPAPVPRELAGWAAARPLKAAARATQLGTAEIEVGVGYRLALAPQAQATLPIAPGKAPAADASGGLLGFTVVRAGRYRVALGAGAWVEVVQNGQARPSVAHGHGPDCTGIRKMVDYDLTPGRYILQLSGSPQAGVTVLLAALDQRPSA